MFMPFASALHAMGNKVADPAVELAPEIVNSARDRCDRRGVERRAFPRRHPTGCIGARMDEWGTSIPRQGRIIDISRNGARFVLAEKARVGQRIRVDLFEPNGRRIATVRAVVVSTVHSAADECQIACRFVRWLSHEQLSRTTC